MARRPLYPVTPGETAVDRLLNQTLPNILKEERARQEREELREEERARYAAEFQYRVNRDTKIDNDNFRKEDIGYGLEIEKSLSENDYASARSLINARDTLYNSKSSFVEEGMLENAKRQDTLVLQGEDIRDNFLSNTLIINSDASPAEKLKAFQYNDKNKDSVKLMIRQKFESSIANTNDPSLQYITNDKNLLGLVQGYGTKFNQMTDTTDKMEASGFAQLSEKELDALVLQMSPQDQKEYAFAGNDPTKNAIRKQKLETIFKQNQTKTFNQTGQKVLEETILQFGGTDGVRQTFVNLRENNLDDIDDLMQEKIVKAADLATRGTAARIKADAEGKTSEFILSTLDEKGFDTQYIYGQKPKKKETKTTTKGFTDPFEGKSAREIIKLVTDPNKDDALLQPHEIYLRQQEKRRRELVGFQNDRILTASEKNELKSLIEELSPYTSEVRLLMNQNYLDRRAKGKPARNLRGTLAKADVKGALKLAEDIEKAESYIEILSNALESSLVEPEKPFGEGYVVPEKIILNEDAKKAFNDANKLLYGKKKILGRQNKSDVKKMIAILNKRIIAADKKLSKDVESIRGIYDLLPNKTLFEIINVSEDGSQDISYKLLDRQ